MYELEMARVVRVQTSGHGRATSPSGARKAWTCEDGTLHRLMAVDSIWIIVTCKGRLDHLKQTAPLLLAGTGARYCLVDYDCPDRSGDWLEATFPDACQRGHVIVERVRDQECFNKSAAQNAGARRALDAGAGHLCFLDADTRVAEGFCSWIAGHIQPNRFLVASRQMDGSDLASLTGVLVVPGKAFRECGGYDESFLGWGAEDIELRLRLYLVHGLDHADIPLELLDPIQHDDELRTRFYPIADPRVSNHRNQKRIHAKIWRQWRGAWKKPVSSAERLWFNAHRDPFRAARARRASSDAD